MMPRTLLPLLLAAVASCSPESTSPDRERPVEDIRAIHIARDGVPVDTLISTGTLGFMRLMLLAELGDGTLRPITEERVVWGSTQPSVIDDYYRDNGDVFFTRHQNGRARLIAAFGGFRDSVTIDIHQVANAVILNADTLVALTPNAIDLSGGPTAYHTMRFGAVRVDSNGIIVASTERIDYDVVGDTLFDLFPEARGDTLSIAGRAVGEGRIAVRVGQRADTVPVQVADRYRVIRFALAPNGAPRPLPATTTIPAGAAIIFRNETPFEIQLGDASTPSLSWHIGPIQPGGRQAQRFATPGTLELIWAGQPSYIIVTP